MDKLLQRRLKKSKTIFSKEEYTLILSHWKLFKLVYLLGLLDRYEIINK